MALPKGSDKFIGKAAPPEPKETPNPELLHKKLIEMTQRAHKAEAHVVGFLGEVDTLLTVLRRALGSLYELDTKAGMIEFWGESDEMPKFIHHPVKNAEADIAHVCSRLREHKEKMSL